MDVPVVALANDPSSRSIVRVSRRRCGLVGVGHVSIRAETPCGCDASGAEASTVCIMAEVAERASIEGLLRLAADVCLSLGAFALSLTGHARVALTAPAEPDVATRIERLARSCLEHPAGRGHDLFWSSEDVEGTGGAERALACAVLPIWLERVLVGFLGIVDIWLPEPDDEQRAALASLAGDLAPQVVLRPSGAPVPGAPVPGTPVPEAPGPSASLRFEHAPGTRSGNGSGAPRWLPAEQSIAETTFSEVPAGEPNGLQARRASQAASGSAPLGPVGAHQGAPAAAPGAPVRAAGRVEAADLVASLDDGVICLDGSGTVVLANRPAEVLYGVGPGATLVGSPLPAADRFWSEEGEPLGDHQPGLLTLRDGTPHSAGILVGAKESQRRFTVSARPFTVGGTGGALVVMHDTTEEWLERQRLSRYAMYDPLTGLANRYLLVEELRRMLQGLGRRGGAIALVFLDLDQFKVINDEHGHDMGDEILSAVARRLRGAVRGDDLVARLGGDEFVLAHLSADPRPDGDLVVARLRKVLSAPFRVRGRVFEVGASIGWVSSDSADVGPEALLARADRAMYRSKRERVARRRGL